MGSERLSYNVLVHPIIETVIQAIIIIILNESSNYMNSLRDYFGMK
jgi:hypothetical protein